MVSLPVTLPVSVHYCTIKRNCQLNLRFTHLGNGQEEFTFPRPARIINRTVNLLLDKEPFPYLNLLHQSLRKVPLAVCQQEALYDLIKSMVTVLCSSDKTDRSSAIFP